MIWLECSSLAFGPDSEIAVTISTRQGNRQELVPTYFQVLFRKWAVRDVTTPNTNEKSGMWGREFSGFRIPETVKEEFDIL